MGQPAVSKQIAALEAPNNSGAAKVATHVAQ